MSVLEAVPANVREKFVRKQEQLVAHFRQFFRTFLMQGSIHYFLYFVPVFYGRYRHQVISRLRKDFLYVSKTNDYRLFQPIFQKTFL